MQGWAFEIKTEPHSVEILMFCCNWIDLYLIDFTEFLFNYNFWFLMWAIEWEMDRNRNKEKNKQNE